MAIVVGVSQLWPKIFPPAKPPPVALVVLLDVSSAMSQQLGDTTKLAAAEDQIEQIVEEHPKYSTSLRLVSGCGTETKDATIPFATNDAPRYDKVFRDLAANQQSVSGYIGGLNSAVDDLTTTAHIEDSKQRHLIVFMAGSEDTCPSYKPPITGLADGLSLNFVWLGNLTAVIDAGIRRQLAAFGFAQNVQAAKNREQLHRTVHQLVVVVVHPHTTSVTTPLQHRPTNTAPPSISGTPQEGYVLTASAGVWSGDPATYTYDWKRCDSGGICTDVATDGPTAVTSSSYTVQSTDVVGDTLLVAVTATNTVGSAEPVSSEPIAVTAPPPPPPPTVTATTDTLSN
ncbi:MAG TPA: hypothetical protein VFU30_14310 [Gaiellaceae bacterium]|nr:hypothetical protein [Gaiellaceae bacterium]